MPVQYDTRVHYNLHTWLHTMQTETKLVHYGKKTLCKIHLWPNLLKTDTFHVYYDMYARYNIHTWPHPLELDTIFVLYDKKTLCNSLNSLKQTSWLFTMIWEHYLMVKHSHASSNILLYYVIRTLYSIYTWPHLQDSEAIPVFYDMRTLHNIGHTDYACFLWYEDTT